MTREQLGIGVVDRPVPKPYVFRYEMHADIYDGDSPKVILDRGMHEFKEEVAVRLYGVDTPEVRGVERPEGLVVRDIVRKWCPPGSKGVLDSHKKGNGKYGRLLATIWPDGWNQSLNERLFDEGLAEIKTYDAKIDAILHDLWSD